MSEYAPAVGALAMVLGVLAVRYAVTAWPAPGRHRASRPRARYRAARPATLTELLGGDQ